MTTLPLPTTPIYETTLPVSGQKIKYRPFLVKEEKVLLIANETDSLEQATLAVRNVVENCTFNKLVLDKTPLADIEYLFIMIRSKSIGEEVIGEITCTHCHEKVDYAINLLNVTVDQKEKVDPNIRIADDVVVTMKYPSMSVASNINEESNGVDVAIGVAAACIDMITVGDTIYSSDDLEHSDIVAYLENMSKKQLDMLATFMDTIPVVVYKDKFKCPKCGEENNVFMEGIGSFFQ